MKKEKLSTSEKIKLTALKLFNENDTLSITTNHIAKEMNISTGNLYYHFKNKEEIILCLYENLSKDFSQMKSFDLIKTSINPLKQLNENFENLTALFYKYRFLLRDSMVLMALYPKIKNLFVINQEKRILQIEDAFEFLTKEEILESSIKSNINKRAKLSWFITSYWQSFASTTGDITKESIKEAKEVYFEFLIYPYLTSKGKEMFTKIL